MSTAKKRLGRGLGNLISGGAGSPPAASPDANAPAQATTARKAVVVRAHRAPEKDLPKGDVIAKGSLPPSGDYHEIAVTNIIPSPYQPRREINAEAVRQLAESIRSEGLLQPIVVRQMPDNSYQLIAGERRWRAHQLLGVKSIMARVMDASDASAAVIALIENLQRENLNPVDEALGYASLMSDFDLTQESVAERVGRARASIANALRLLQLDREVQGYLAKGMISVGHAKVLLGVEDAHHRALLARQVIEAALSVRELERMVKKLREGKSSASGSGTSATASSVDQVIANLEKEISSRVNTTVQLKHTPKKGRIIIEYYGNDDLQRILEKTGLQSQS